jgi:hypothetical protein
VDNHDHDRWNQLLLIACGAEAQQVDLPEGSWQVLADDKSSFCWQEQTLEGRSVLVPGVSTMILGRIPK